MTGVECVAVGCDRPGVHWLFGVGEFCGGHRPGPRRNYALDFSDDELRREDPLDHE